MFFSVDCQLLLTCLQHRFLTSVLNPAHRVMSMSVNHLHKVFSKTYREVFSVDREKVHHAYLVLPHSSSPTSGVERKRWIHLLSVHRDENDSSDNYRWVLKIPLNIWSPVFQSSYMRTFHSDYMCIVAKRSHLVTSAFCHMSNWHGVVQLCSTGFHYLAGGLHLTWVHLHSSNIKQSWCTTTL